MKPAEQRSDIEQASLERSNQLTDELLAADVLVMAAPMYNFAIPSTLKAWLDHVLRAGVTFKYTETGPQGLLSGKRAFVLTARGGIYAGSTADHQEPYLRQVMGFIGIHDVTFKYTETGPQGLLTGKRAYVLTARGGIYAGSTADHQEPYLRQVMGFIGIHDVEFIHAEGMNLGGDFQEKGLNQANAKLAQVA